MKNQFVFDNSNLTPKAKSDAVINSINRLIRHKTPDHFIPYIQLKTVLNNFDTPVVLNNAYRGIEHSESDFDFANKATAIKIDCGLIIHGERDYDFYVNETTTINVYCGLTICIYKFRTGDKNNKSGFYYMAEKTIDIDPTPDYPCSITKAAEAPEAKAAEVKKPIESTKPEPEMDMTTRLSKAQDYFALNKIFADNFDKFISESIESLTNNLINIRETINSFPSPFINLTAGEIEKYIKPFDNIIALIDIENPDKAAYMIKSAFNALLIAHMDARLNNEDEDLHIEYNVNSK